MGKRSKLGYKVAGKLGDFIRALQACVRDKVDFVDLDLGVFAFFALLVRGGCITERLGNLITCPDYS